MFLYYGTCRKRYGLYIYPASRSAVNNPAPVINGNGIYGNTSYDLYAYNYFDAVNITLNATGNWWGTTVATSVAYQISGNVGYTTVLLNAI